MIAIGSRAPEEELFGIKPKEPIAILGPADPYMILNGIDKSTGKAKINRLVLSRTAVVELLEAESPSKIWVRLTNHIADKDLTIREPEVVTPKQNVQIGDYALAPCEERVYKRCRVEEFKDTDAGRKAVIFFIDDATRSLVNPECLCEMDEHYMYYPWQAIQLAIFGIFPGSYCNFNKARIWPLDTCERLREILTTFPYLRVECVLSSIVYNDFARPCVCNLFGMENEFDTKKSINIGDLLISLSDSPVFTVVLYDSAHHEFFDCEENEELKYTYHEIQEQKAVQIGSKDAKKTEEEGNALFNDKVDPDAKDWDPELCQVPVFTKADLRSFVDESTGRVMMSIEGNCTKSPYEWYGRPIQKVWMDKNGETVTPERYSCYDPSELRETDENQWMITGNEDLISSVEQLDKYYSNVKNRRPLDPEEIKRLHGKGIEVYAVCAVNEEKADYTGEWQRVQILSCDTFAEVRFLDSGGRDIVLTSSLYRIHEQHCRYPPKCLHMSMQGIKSSSTRSDGKWIIAEISRFKTLLREDVPICIQFDDIELLNKNKEVQRENQPPYLANHVFFVRDFHAYNEDVGMVNQFVGNQLGQATIDVSKPVPWIVQLTDDSSDSSDTSLRSFEKVTISEDED